jgi:hypothetical protein
MAPFPDADHCIWPGAAAEAQYARYGALFGALRGKEWVLEPHAVRVVGKAGRGGGGGGAVAANAFDVGGVGGVGGGAQQLWRLWPVVFAEGNSTVDLSAVAPTGGCAQLEVLLPGAGSSWAPLPHTFGRGAGDGAGGGAGDLVPRCSKRTSRWATRAAHWSRVPLACDLVLNEHAFALFPQQRPGVNREFSILGIRKDPQQHHAHHKGTLCIAIPHQIVNAAATRAARGWWSPRLPGSLPSAGARARGRRPRWPR